MWAAALVLLLIGLFYGWPFVARVVVDAARPVREPPGPDTPEPPNAASVADVFSPGLTDVEYDDLLPPRDLHSFAPWDDYWRKQNESGLWALNELFVDDRDLLRVIEARGFKNVLCVGSGLALEPHALAAAGLHVTILDISPYVIAAMNSAVASADAFARILDDSQLRVGGNLECVAGDLTDPAVCPGPFDVVIERKTLQLFPEAERQAALAAVAERMIPNGILLTHAHDALGGPGRSSHHPLEALLARCGFIQRDFEASRSATGRTAITLLSTG